MRSREISALAALAAAALAGCAAGEPPGRPAAGSYRIPYQDGDPIWVSHDFNAHEPRGRYDLVGLAEGRRHRLAAAADGWIRFLVDGNSRRGAGNNNFIWIEHPYPFCQPEGVTWPGKPDDYDSTCAPCEEAFCNEWTKYSHLTQRSASRDAGLSVGDFVRAGDFLGYEGDVGRASRVHLHWEVAVLDPAAPLRSPEDGWAWDWSGGGWPASPNLLPSICGQEALRGDERYEAGPCEQARTLTP